MRSTHSSDNSCRTAPSRIPHLPLQVVGLEVVEVPLPDASLYLVGSPADVSACRSLRRAAGPPHRPLQAACLVVVVVHQPDACLGRVHRLADLQQSLAWPLFNDLFLQMICKFEGRWLFPASPDCVQFEAVLLWSVVLLQFPSKLDSPSFNETNTKAETPLPP